MQIMKRDPCMKTLWLTIVSWANTVDDWDHAGKSKIKVKRGQLLTSAIELGEEIGCDRRVVKRYLDQFTALEMILPKTMYRGCLITVLDYDCMTYTTEAWRSRHSPETVTRHGHDNVIETVTRMTHNKIKSKNKNKKGGEEAPHFLKKSNPDESGNQDRAPTPAESNKNPPPAEAIRLRERWGARCRELVKMRSFSDLQIDDEIAKMAVFYTHAELHRMLDYLEMSQSKVAKELITPFDHSKKFFAGPATLLEQAVIESKLTAEGKALQERKKTEEREIEKKRLEEEDKRKMRSQEATISIDEVKRKKEERLALREAMKADVERARNQKQS